LGDLFPFRLIGGETLSKTAKALDLVVLPTFMIRADLVIEYVRSWHFSDFTGCPT
jgi:hypothetical protein